MASTKHKPFIFVLELQVIFESDLCPFSLKTTTPFPRLDSSFLHNEPFCVGTLRDICPLLLTV